MRHKRLDHNRGIMLGIMAMAIVVLSVVVTFWLWCFPGMFGPEGTVQQQPARMIVLTQGFCQQEVSLQLNDSILYQDQLMQDSLVLPLPPSAEEQLLMVSLPRTGYTYSFALPAGKGCYRLVYTQGAVSLHPLPH